MAVESELFVLGIWKNFEEIEQNLTLPEIDAILKESRRAEFQRRKFAAALKGVDLPDENADGEYEGAPTFEDIKRRAQGKLEGKSDEQIAFEEIGFAFEEE